jgi:hypothetical protein
MEPQRCAAALLELDSITKVRHRCSVFSSTVEPAVLVRTAKRRRHDECVSRQDVGRTDELGPRIVFAPPSKGPNFSTHVRLTLLDDRDGVGQFRCRDAGQPRARCVNGHR